MLTMINIETLPTEIKTKSLNEIVRIIKRDWAKINFSAVPYLEALSCLGSLKENYIADSGVSVALYFLGNAGSWRGPVAKIVKTELKERIKLASR